MSLQIDVEDYNKGIQEILKGVTKWIEESTDKQRVCLIMKLWFKPLKKKKDC